MKHLIIIVTSMMMLLTACSKDNDDLPQDTNENYIITYVPCVFGLGDSASTDSCYAVIYAKALEHNILLELIPPDENTSPENVIDSWWKRREQVKNRKRLLILGDPSYGNILKERGYSTGIKGDILVVDSRDTKLSAYTIYSSLYGACYLSGLLAGEKAFFPDTDFGQRTILLMANPHDQVVKEAADGFRDGLKHSCQETPNEYYLSNDPNGGYTEYESALGIMKLICPGHRYLLPLIGGNNRILHNEAGPNSNQANIYFTGVDSNINNNYGRQLNYFYKNFKHTIGGFIDNWYSGSMPELHQLFTLSNNGTCHHFGKQVLLGVAGPEFENDYLDKLLREAEKKEEEYYANK